MIFARKYPSYDDEDYNYSISFGGGVGYGSNVY